MRLFRTTRLITAAGVATLLGGAAAAGLVAAPNASNHTVRLAKTTHNMPSAQFWAAKQGEKDAPFGPAPYAVYQGNTDQVFLDLVHQAAALGESGHAWDNAGPNGGVVDIPNIGSGNELFGPVDGIGTALAVDPSDASGNTVYLGTIGGLWKTTDGGKTMTNLSKGFARESIGAIAVDPANHNTVIAGTGVSIFTLSDDAAGTGVYVSHDAGKTWTRPSANTHGYGVNSIAFTPSGTILVGTSYGLWRSTDGGASFHQVTLPTNANHNGPAPHPLGNWVTSVVVNPTAPHDVTVAVGYAFGKLAYPDGSVLAPGNGLYRSTNDGASFSYFAGTAGLTNPQASSDPFGRTSLAYSPAPGGTNVLWALVQDAGKAASASNKLCVDTPALPECLDGNSVLNGIYRSADDGATWSLVGTPQTLATALGGTTSAAGYPIDYGPGVQGQYNNWILPDLTDPNRVYVGLEEAFTGEFNGATATWTAIEKYSNACGFITYYNTPPNTNGVSCPQQIPEYGSGTTHPDQHSAVFAKTPSGFRMYSGNDGGWWAQDAHNVSDTTSPSYQGFDNGSWSSLGKPPTVLPWDVTPLQDGSFLLALQDNGVAHVRPNGTAYQVCGGDGVYVYPGANAKSYYCGIDGQTILGTTDDFAHTIALTPPFVGATFLSPWAVDASDPNHLIAAAGDVDETTAGVNSNTYDPTDTVVVSTTWKSVFTPPTPPHHAWDSSAVYTRGPVSYVAFCSACRPSLGTGTAATPTVVTPEIATNIKDGCTPKKADSACWHMAASKGLPHEQISDIAVDPNNAKTIYVGLRQFIVMGADPHVTGAEKIMVSHDGGNTFTDLSGNLPRADVHRIALRDGQLFAATDVGIFTAKAGSTTWQRFGTGIPQVAVRSMRLSLDGRYLLAGVYGRGGWLYDFHAAAQTPLTQVPKGIPHGTSGSVIPKTGMSSTIPMTGLGVLLAWGAVAVHRRRRSSD